MDVDYLTLNQALINCTQLTLETASEYVVMYNRFEDQENKYFIRPLKELVRFCLGFVNCRCSKPYRIYIVMKPKQPFIGA